MGQCGHLGPLAKTAHYLVIFLDILLLECIINRCTQHLHKGNTMSNHETLKTAFDTYMSENEKFTTKGVKAAAARARKALQEMSKAIKERRKEITAEKEAMAAK